MTPVLSVDAFQPSVIAVCVWPLAASPVGAVGACVSPAGAHGLVATVMVGRLDVLPAASYASTASV